MAARRGKGGGTAEEAGPGKSQLMQNLTSGGETPTQKKKSTVARKKETAKSRFLYGFNKNQPKLEPWREAVFSRGSLGAGQEGHRKNSRCWRGSKVEGKHPGIKVPGLTKRIEGKVAQR